MSGQYCLVFCTCPNFGVATDLGKQIVVNRLGACVNILPSVTSIYPWDDKIEIDMECLLLIKSNEDRYSALERFLEDKHPYELPEVIAVPLQHGSAPYLEWVGRWLNSE